ncbi:uncharacterized protein LOC128863982 [Anastrepha ludens]|uniref:uncharacterized protein LOC128863980 n=1 Tax=Anastrepha ludens TaxID=28586 RepID=UPI0023B0E345|nr:uncharacterized protein LOC128863980 [Anastrepha ludens]XP_053959410.1 uncharacterized protein LOC128863982 [Anastrepha ludens]
MDNKQLPTSSCKNEQNKEVFMACTQNLIEQKCAKLEQHNFYLSEKVNEMNISDKENKQKITGLKQNNFYLNKKLSEMIIINKESKQNYAELEQNNLFLVKKLHEMSIINKECKQNYAELKQNNAELKQNNIYLNKELSEMIFSYKECEQKVAELEKQLNDQTKVILKLKNKDRRSKQQRYFPQQRHSQQEDNFHQQDTPPQMQSYHVLSPKNTQQREEVTCLHSDLQGQPEQHLEPNNTHVQYMAQKVHGDIQASPQKYHTVPANSNMGENIAEVTEPRIINSETIINNQTNSMARKKSRALKKQPHEKVRDENILKDIIFTVATRSGVSEEEVRNTIATIRAEEETPRHANCTNDGHPEIGEAFQGNNLDLLCSVAAGDMAIYFPDEQKRKANVMEYESDTEQNGSQEHVRVQPHSKRAVATKRPTPQSSKRRCRWIRPGLSQEVSQCPLQPLQIDANNTNDKVAYVSIGPNKTLVPQKYYESIDFTNASVATRKLLVICFDRETLATHSLTGRRSPAFKDKPLKEALDPLIVDDIIFAVTTRSGVSAKEVRAAITTKCADENKMWRKKHPELSKKTDKENVGNYTF